MSRVGNTPIAVPKDVTVLIGDGSVVVKGPKGELSCAVPSMVTVTKNGDIVKLSCLKEDTYSRALHGLIRAKLANAVLGVTKGWSKTLELHGVGYRAAFEGLNLVLTVGFSHSVTVAPPTGITFTVAESKITVSGTDKEIVGQVAAKIRAIKKPEPYKGKGIRYAGEHIRKKAGKAAKAIGGAPVAPK